MNYLSLFSGAGGGDLAAQHLKGWTCVGYVEFNDYCQRVIKARIEDGLLDRAPIFGDVRAFISDGYAASYTGLVDCITGGFPCQPFSAAGKQLGADDPRNMWPATVECIRIIRPRFAFMENVAALISSGYFGTILGDLAESGYDARWRILSAAELGAPHKRDRVWIVADAVGAERWPQTQSGEFDTRGEYTAPQKWQQGTDGLADVCEDVPHAQGARLAQPTRGGRGEAEQPRPQRGRLPVRGTPRWWVSEPRLARLANRIPNRVDRTKCVGNAQIPAVAAAAWDLLAP